MRRGNNTQVASSVPFDDDTSQLGADNVQEAIDLINSGAGTGASPGFSFGRSGNVSTGTYLQNETVPSNITGRPIDLTDGRVIQVSISNQNINTFTIELELHDGTNFTSLGFFPLIASRTGKFTLLNLPLVSGSEMSAKVSSGSGKNIIVTVYVKGDAS